MNNEQSPYNDQDQLFADYYHGRLAPEASHELEERLDKDEKLRAAFELYKESAQLAESLGVRDLMKKVIEERARPKRSIQRYLIGFTAVAASVLIGFFLFRQEATDHVALFDQYFKSYPDLTNSRQAGTSSHLREAMDLYVKGDFESATALLQQQPTKNDTLRLYLGTSLLASGQSEKALSVLSEIEQPIFEEASLWYQALSKIRLGRITEAKELLQKLTESAAYETRSKELLKALD